MKEAEFIKQNRDKWRRFEELSASSAKNPEEYSNLFVEITNDLSFAQSHYDKRTVRVYLNNLAQKVFLKLYKRNRTGVNAFLQFWVHDLPLEMYRARLALLVSFLFFTLSALLGVLGSLEDPDYLRVILGDGYVNMTESYIEQGDPMAVYKQSNRIDMFFQITINNIQVSFLAFVMGIFFGLGTIYILVKNGMMLGAFQYFFHLKGLLLTSFLTVWIHGALEISAIVIAGSAGITIGRGLIFTGSYTRLQSLYKSAKSGVRIMIGLVPIFIAAGFLESYVTRHTEMADGFKWFIILGSFSFIFGYFVVYPWLKFRKNCPAPEPLSKLVEDSTPIELRESHKSATIFVNTFRMLGQVVSKLWISKIFLIVFAGVLIWYGVFEHNFKGYSRNPIVFLQNQLSTDGSGMFKYWIVWLVLLVYFSGKSVMRALANRSLTDVKPKRLNHLFLALPVSIILVIAVFYVLSSARLEAWLLAPFVLNVVLFPIGTIFAPDYQGIQFVTKSISLSFRNYSSVLMNVLGFSFLGLATYILLFDPLGVSPISDFIQDFISWHLTVGDDVMLVMHTLMMVLWVVFMMFLVPALVTLSVLHIYSAFEQENALGLKKVAEKFGATKRKSAGGK